MKIIWKIEFKVSFLLGKWDKAIFQYIWKMHPSLLPLKRRSNKASLKRQTFVVFLVFVCDIRGAADFFLPCWCWNLINVNRWGLEYSQSIKQTRHYFPYVNEASKICYQNCESCLEYGFSLSLSKIRFFLDPDFESGSSLRSGFRIQIRIRKPLINPL